MTSPTFFLYWFILQISGCKQALTAGRSEALERKTLEANFSNRTFIRSDLGRVGSYSARIQSCVTEKWLIDFEEMLNTENPCSQELRPRRKDRSSIPVRVLFAGAAVRSPACLPVFRFAVSRLVGWSLVRSVRLTECRMPVKQPCRRRTAIASCFSHCSCFCEEAPLFR